MIRIGILGRALLLQLHYRFLLQIICVTTINNDDCPASTGLSVLTLLWLARPFLLHFSETIAVAVYIAVLP